MILNSENIIQAFKGTDINNNLELYQSIKKAEKIKWTLNNEIDDYNQREER